MAADKRVPPQSKNRNWVFILRNLEWLPFLSMEFLFGFFTLYYWSKAFRHTLWLNLILPTSSRDTPIALRRDDDDYFADSNFIGLCVKSCVLLVAFILICHCVVEFLILYTSRVRIMLLSIYVPTDVLAEKVYNFIVAKRNNSGKSPVSMTHLLFCQCLSMLIVLVLNDDWFATVGGNRFFSGSDVNATTVNTTQTLADQVVGSTTFTIPLQPVLPFGTFVLSLIFLLKFVMLEYHLLKRVLLSRSASIRASCLRDMEVDQGLARSLSTKFDFREMEFILALERNDILPKLNRLLLVNGGKSYVVKPRYFASISSISHRVSIGSRSRFQSV